MRYIAYMVYSVLVVAVLVLFSLRDDVGEQKMRTQYTDKDVYGI